MKRFALLTMAVGLFLPLLASAPAQAQARTWVSGVGDDVNPCSRTAPCKTFAGAISKTATNGEIDCLDPGGYGAVTITKSITIDCTGTFGSVLVAGTNGITINITNAGGTDPLQTVRLRGLSINGSNLGNRAGIRGVSILSALEVYIDNVVIDNFTQQAVADVRSGAGTLFVTNSNFRNSAVGIAVAGAAGTTAILDNVTSEGNSYGIAAGAGNRVTVSRSTISGNSAAGVEGDGGSLIIVDGSSINANAIAVQSASAVRLSSTNIVFNGTAISGATGTFGNNRFTANGAAGTTLTPVAGASNDLGQQ